MRAYNSKLKIEKCKLNEAQNGRKSLSLRSLHAVQNLHANQRGGRAGTVCPPMPEGEAGGGVSMGGVWMTSAGPGGTPPDGTVPGETAADGGANAPGGTFAAAWTLPRSCSALARS